jgi:ABC-type nitrate/sulfonate/bicarbonate transport system permease component
VSILGGIILGSILGLAVGFAVGLVRRRRAVRDAERDPLA